MGAAFRGFTPTETNLEATSIVWLDGSVNKLQESIDAQQRLRRVIKNLTAFERTDLCEKYIKSLAEADRITLIVSGALGKEIVCRVHPCRQVISIYVYCGDKEKNKDWIKPFPKVRGLAVTLDELIGQIRSEQANEEHNKNEAPITFTTFNAKEQQTVGLNGQFVHSQLLIDCLLRIDSTSADMTDFISRCKQDSHDDEKQLDLIREFKDEYSSNKAVRWYTRHSFVYQMLNRALRAQDIHLLFLARFLIRDLGQQLKDNQCTRRLTVYRGQLMRNEEFQSLKESVGQLISMNSFLSTSSDRDLAFKFVGESTDLEHVLFEIDADPRAPGIKPFADISSLSVYPEEKEVLFMLGSIFRINSITRDRNKTWTVKLTLCSNRDNDLKNIIDELKSQDEQASLSLVTLGNVLRRMGKYNEAEKYYRRCLNQLPSNDLKSMSICYYELGCLEECKGDNALSINWLNKSLEIDIKTLKPDDPNIANTHNSMGNNYQVMGDDKRALESYNKALTIFRRAPGDNDLHIATCLNNIGAVYQKETKYSEALNYYKDAMAIRQKRLSPNHPDVGASHNNIGIIYRNLGHPDRALEQYNLALRIYNESLPPDHSDIAMTLENIGIVYEEEHEWDQALSYYKRAEAIYQQTYSSTHNCVVQIKKRIQQVSSKRK